MNYAAINIRVQFFMQTCVFDSPGYTHRSGIMLLACGTAGWTLEQGFATFLGKELAAVLFCKSSFFFWPCHEVCGILVS